ncbi:competence protein CoiA family protein [Dasania sp. GY-19]|uniref:Competence protein CoiA family protein n=1 Tax=Dasania phycosphaerae TaxID=2950436 RepID=A0A9J6RQV2_9GAMM|nr:competence protein CoiA family protein [Dasania phycosphaerae]MCZ0866519.1 competence protein CoiA family protein [Dasania phycosphaerae]
MKELKIPFARLDDGGLVGVKDVQKESCNYFCPDCGSELVLRKGDIRQKHFSHKSKAHCAASYETEIHRAAKEVIKNSSMLLINRRTKIGELSRALMDKSGAEYCDKTKKYLIRYDKCKVEPTIRALGIDIRPDALVFVKAQPIAIEIRVTHGVEDNKIEFYEQIGIDCLEINLERLPEAALDSNAEFNRLVLEKSDRLWIHNNHDLRRLLEFEGASYEASLPFLGQYEIKDNAGIHSTSEQR